MSKFDYGQLTHTNSPELLHKLYVDASIRAHERMVMCDEKDATIERLRRLVQAYRQTIWEHLIYTRDDGCTASGYSYDDIPDELLMAAVVDSAQL